MLEVDELHVPHVAKSINTQALVLLNLSRDQLDRVGEINKIERALRGAVEDNPDMLVIANCDDVLMTSVAYDAENVIWVSAGAGWFGDSVSCPRTGGHIVRTSDDWYAVKKLADGREFRRPTPIWAVDDNGMVTPTGEKELNLSLPGRANRGNATQAVSAAVEAFEVNLDDAIAAAEQVADVAGRYSTIHRGNHEIRLLLAKNPAGWQEALSMIDRAIRNEPVDEHNNALLRLGLLTGGSADLLVEGPADLAGVGVDAGVGHAALVVAGEDLFQSGRDFGLQRRHLSAAQLLQ